MSKIIINNAMIVDADHLMLAIKRENPLELDLLLAGFPQPYTICFRHSADREQVFQSVIRAKSGESDLIPSKLNE